MTVFGQFGTKTEKYFELCNYCKCDLGKIRGMRLNMTGLELKRNWNRWLRQNKDTYDDCVTFLQIESCADSIAKASHVSLEENTHKRQQQ